jgi:hypothetical protein
MNSSQSWTKALLCNFIEIICIQAQDPESAITDSQ